MRANVFRFAPATTDIAKILPRATGTDGGGFQGALGLPAGGTLGARSRCTSKTSPREDFLMMKIALAVASSRSCADDCPARHPGEGPHVETAQGVDVQIERDRDDRYDRDRYDRDRRQRFASSSTTVGIGPGGVTVGPRQRCRRETTTIERRRPHDHALGAPLRKTARLTDGDDVFSGPPHQSFDQRGIGLPVLGLLTLAATRPLRFVGCDTSLQTASC